MKVNTIRVQGVAVIELSGRLTIAKGHVLSEEMRSVLAAGHRNVIVDFSGVDAIDSSGLGELLSCRALANREAAEISLVGIRRAVREILEMTQLMEVFEVFESIDVALKSHEKS